MLDPRLIAQMQNRGNQQSAMRSGKSGTGLLDDGENNVGNATSVPPQILPIGFEFTIQRQNNPPRILNLTADTNKGQDITLVMTAARDPNQPGGSGPLTESSSSVVVRNRPRSSSTYPSVPTSATSRR